MDETTQVGFPHIGIVKCIGYYVPLQ